MVILKYKIWKNDLQKLNSFSNAATFVIVVAVSDSKGLGGNLVFSGPSNVLPVCPAPERTAPDRT